MSDDQKAVPLISPPKYQIGATVRIANSDYTFKIFEILYDGSSMWRYRGNMMKSGRLFRPGVITERGLIG